MDVAQTALFRNTAVISCAEPCVNDENMCRRGSACSGDSGRSEGDADRRPTRDEWTPPSRLGQSSGVFVGSDSEDPPIARALFSSSVPLPYSPTTAPVSPPLTVAGRAIRVATATGGKGLDEASPGTLRSMSSGSLSPPLIPPLPPVATSPAPMLAPPLPALVRSQSGGSHPRSVPGGFAVPRRATSASFDSGSDNNVMQSQDPAISAAWSPVSVQESRPASAMAPESPAVGGSVRSTDPALRSPLGPGSPNIRRRATICGTPTRTPRSHDFSAVQSPPGLISPGTVPQSSLPPTPDAMILLRKIVELYARAVDAKAEADGGVRSMSPANRDDVLVRVVSSSSWATVAGTILARIRIMFTEVYGQGHVALANAWKLEGLLAAQVGSWSAGALAFSAALSLCEAPGVSMDPHIIAGLRYNLGVCYSESGDHASAAGCFRAVADVYTSTYGPDHNLTRQADAKLQLALRCGMQEQYTSLYSASLRALAERRYQDAHASLEKCLELVPQDPACAYSIATCCCKLGCCGYGMAWLATAVEWGYDDWETADQDAELAVLRSLPAYAEIRLRARCNESPSDEDVDVDCD